jgi:cyclopropane fatty-acyl-phospholipid synthase-like methyltransferase
VITKDMQDMASFWDVAYLVGAPWDIGEAPRELTELVDDGKLEPGTVLDIGCGTGTAVVFLAARGFKASGLDISRVAIKKAERKAARHSVTCRFYRLDFTDSKDLASAGLSTFDLLIDNGCYHSLSPNDRDWYASSLLRVSRVGTVYLLWGFLRGSRPGFGPPGIERNEVEDRFSINFRIQEKHGLESSYSTMLFYVMERQN